MIAFLCGIRACNDGWKGNWLSAKIAKDSAILFLFLFLHHFEPRLGRYCGLTGDPDTTCRGRSGQGVPLRGGGSVSGNPTYRELAV